MSLRWDRYSNKKYQSFCDSARRRVNIFCDYIFKTEIFFIADRFGHDCPLQSDQKPAHFLAQTLRCPEDRGAGLLGVLPTAEPDSVMCFSPQSLTLCCPAYCTESDSVICPAHCRAWLCNVLSIAESESVMSWPPLSLTLWCPACTYTQQTRCAGHEHCSSCVWIFRWNRNQIQNGSIAFLAVAYRWIWHG